MFGPDFSSRLSIAVFKSFVAVVTWSFVAFLFAATVSAEPIVSSRTFALSSV